MLKKLLVVFSCTFLILTLNAQEEMGLHFMRHTLQASKTNPALLPDQKFIVGLPGGSFQFFHTSGSFNDIIDTSPADGSNVDFGNRISLLEEENELFTNLELETFRLFYRFGKLGINFNHAIKFTNEFIYPDTYIKLTGQGNGQFVGQTIDFGPDIQQTTYNEYGLGLSFDLLDQLTIAVRPKLLMGIGNISTINPDVSLFTDDDFYQITINSNYEVNSVQYLEYDTDGFFDLNYPSPTGSDLFSSNRGTAIDLGVHWRPTKRLSIAASVVDLGAKIDWKDGGINYASNTRTTYEGITINFDDVLQGETTNFDDLDTINFDNLFQFKETAVEYSTDLPTKYYLSAAFQFNDMLTFSGLFHNESFMGENRQAFSFGVQARLSELLTLGGNYSYRFDKATNIGLNATVKLGPVQVFAVTDNIVGAVRIFDAENANIRFGLNLLFGSRKSSEEAVEFVDPAIE